MDRSLHLQVRTSVAVRLGHSAVSTNTADMQRYWGDKINWDGLISYGDPNIMEKGFIDN